MTANSGGWTGNLIDVHGEAGRNWLERLPTTLAHVATDWSLHILPPFPELNYNYVAPAVRADGTPAVLKAGVPNDEFKREIAALRVFEGNGMARLLEEERATGVMLLERLQRGHFLSELDDDEEITRCALTVLRAVSTHPPPDHHFISLSDWEKRTFREVRSHFGGGFGPFPRDLVDRVGASASAHGSTVVPMR